MSTAVQEQEETALMIPTDLHITRAPKEVLEGATEAAVALKDVISRKLKKVVFNGEQYLQYEDWQTIGGFFSCSVATGEAELVQIDGVPGFKAKARVIDANGIEVSTAEAYCMKDEANWKTKPFFQLASMAQTRAGAKALRNKFAWVAVLAGYSPTPAEEMIGTETVESQDNDAECPECGGAMWDNRTTKRNPKAPDYKCKDKSCNGVIWQKKTEGFGNDQVLRDELFNKAEQYMVNRKYPVEKRKDALGRLVQLTTEEMGKAVEKLVTGAKPDSDTERQKKIADIQKWASAENVAAYVDEHFNGKPLTELDLDALTKMYDDLVVPF